MQQTHKHICPMSIIQCTAYFALWVLLGRWVLSLNQKPCYWVSPDFHQNGTQGCTKRKRVCCQQNSMFDIQHADVSFLNSTPFARLMPRRNWPLEGLLGHHGGFPWFPPWKSCLWMHSMVFSQHFEGIFVYCIYLLCIHFIAFWNHRSSAISKQKSNIMA